MDDIFDWAYSAAQLAAGTQPWEKLSDLERMQAITRQIDRLDVSQIGRSLAMLMKQSHAEALHPSPS
jgi:hypothetical protein